MDNTKLNKKISIIIPVYNSEDFLNTCLDSLTKQSYKNLELIVVNDGSPKNCKEIAHNILHHLIRQMGNRINYILFYLLRHNP